MERWERKMDVPHKFFFFLMELIILILFYLFIYFLNFFIQLQLSAFSPHSSTPPHLTSLKVSVVCPCRCGRNGGERDKWLCSPLRYS